MFKTTAKIMATAAAAGLAFAPIAASANTRAADAPVYSAASGPGLDRSVEGEGVIAPGILAAIFAALIAAGIIIIADDDDDDNQSPGAN
jgi:hypothetical protein